MEDSFEVQYYIYIGWLSQENDRLSYVILRSQTQSFTQQLKFVIIININTIQKDIAKYLYWFFVVLLY